MECMNIMADVDTELQNTETATLMDKAVNQIMNAIDFEEIKARAIVIMLRNKAMGPYLPGGNLEKGQAENNGEVDRGDYLIDSFMDR